VAHDGARVKDDFVAGVQDASAGVHVFVVGAEAQVVAADFAKNAGAKNGAEAAEAIGHGRGDLDEGIAEILAELKRAPEVRGSDAKVFEEAAAGAGNLGIVKMFEERREPLGIGDGVGVKRSQQGIGGVGQSGVARYGKALVMSVANDAYGIFCGDFGAIIGGTVVNNKKLVGRTGLIEDGGDGVRKVGGAVVTGDIGGDFWQRSHGSGGLQMKRCLQKKIRGDGMIAQGKGAACRPEKG